MHKLARKIRFSINPFLDTDDAGENSFTSKPTGRGLAVFLELEIAIVGSIENSTGFVINVTEIDRIAAEYAVPLFAEKIRQSFRSAKHLSLNNIIQIIRQVQLAIEDKFQNAILSELNLNLNPFRKLMFDCEDKKMVYLSEKFEFAATHKLWNNDFSEQKNYQLFGKCANPAGHGHNYILDVTVKMPQQQQDFSFSEFEKIVSEHFIQAVDHKNLNLDLPYFKKNIATVENIAVFAWDNIVDNFANAKLHCVTVWETDKTYCSYYG